MIVTRGSGAGFILSRFLTIHYHHKKTVTVSNEMDAAVILVV